MPVGKEFAEKFVGNANLIVVDIRNWITNILTGEYILEKVLSGLVDYYSQYEKFVREHVTDQQILNELGATRAKLTHHIKKCKII